ncbi:hypothetical protein AB0I77_18770 [Streptomyces sp. NPDC050619]|uniref:hypothetical protein n=1 Tax=Streptomyces sp. NPDC050619 TaxID=3157214 RepID=UPI00344AE53F
MSAVGPPPRQNGLTHVSLTELSATSRVTVFPLERLTVAYTTQSSDERGLGDIGLVTVVAEHSDGEELWRLARDLGGRANGADQARWILTQASRVRMVNAYTDLPRATWTAYIRRRVELDALFANHDILMTGRIALLGSGLSALRGTVTPPAGRPASSRSSAPRASQR